MRKVRRLFVVAIGFGTAAALSGCVVIASQSSQQLDTIGAVKLTTTACFSQQPDCTEMGNSNTPSNVPFQGLVGYRLPTDVSTPQMISSSAGQPLSFTRDPSYADELQRLAPAGRNQKWVGYRSAATAANPLNPSFTVSPTFSLKQGQDGTPFQGPFAYRVVVGARGVPGNTNQPVACGSSLFGSSDTRTVCVDSPAPSELGVNLIQPTQDIGIVSDATARKADRGDTTPLSFKLLYAGKAGSPPLVSLRASTNIPDGGAKSVPANLTPPGGSSKARVLLQIPRDTPPGSYDVTLVATTAGGQVRSRTHELQVGPGRRGVGCNSLKPTISGTRGRDRLVGTRRRDVIAGYGGDDRILGRDGRDLICAGAGDDRAKGGGGSDMLIGLGGNDMLAGGKGRDVMLGGRGDDRFKH